MTDPHEPRSYHFTDETGCELVITPIDQATARGVSLAPSCECGICIRPGDAESVIAAIRRGCGLDPAPVPGRLDLAPIIADLHTAATPPTSGGLVDVTMTDSFQALERISDRHVLDLLAEVTMLRGLLAEARTDADRDRLGAELAHARAERDRHAAELTTVCGAVDRVRAVLSSRLPQDSDPDRCGERYLAAQVRAALDGAT
ncbi:hypothetical protein [Embleya sp. NPDC059237]|uniref:hypothetical protein n=1 Tax=Embleya sp. NPDC059237 TaxID=3346784 RepID=UPI00368ADF6D